MILTVQQGRTVYLTISVKTTGGATYTLQTGDKIRFGVRPVFGSDYVILKKLTSANEVNGKYPLVLTPEDTNIAPKRYFYDCSVQLADGSFHDIAKSEDFIVRNSVTFKGDE